MSWSSQLSMTATAITDFGSEGYTFLKLAAASVYGSRPFLQPFLAVRVSNVNVFVFAKSSMAVYVL